ncbi:hypothetical protein FOZ60_012848 [Perkinsus olseni]|uniref:Uncharacterized protein n=1 Tax=Perkinsus olseni TaxID=32597 RepID=A0A7J6NAG7_PEROL|nr:hypothetical protein FOZ60_012848 [Perkinsus olseni]
MPDNRTRRASVANFLLRARDEGRSVRDEVSDLVRSALAPSTRKTYGSAETLFRDVIFGPNVSMRSIYPATGEMILTFIYIMDQVGYPYSTIRTYTSALRTRHLEEGYVYPEIEAEHIKRALIAVRKRQGTMLTDVKEKQPLTVAQMRLVVTKCGQKHGNICTAILLCTFALLRSRECLSLRCDEIHFERVDGMDTARLLVRRSKCDQVSAGVVLRIGCAMSSTAQQCNEDLCAVHSLYGYMCDGFRSGRLSRDGLVFPNLNRAITGNPHGESPLETVYPGVQGVMPKTGINLYAETFVLERLESFELFQRQAESFCVGLRVLLVPANSVEWNLKAS